MRYFLGVIIIVSLCITACKKNTGSGSGGTQPPPPPPPSGGSGGTSKVTITAISPLIAYQGDVITITGTGFDPNMLKDTVLIGISGGSPKGFTPRGLANPFYPNPVGNIISATATEIKFRTDSTVLFSEADEARFALQISAPSGSLFTADTLFLKAIPSITSVTSTDPYAKPVCEAYKIYSGDSIFISGRSLIPPLTITIDGKPMDYQRIVQTGNYNTNTQRAAGFIGIDYFGITTPTPDGTCTVSHDYDKTVKVVNGDGRSVSMGIGFHAGPNSQFFNVSMAKTSYSKSKDGEGLLTIDGYAIRNFTIQITGTDPATQQPFMENLAGHDGDLVGTFTSQIDFGALPNPASDGTLFQIKVKDSYGNTVGGGVVTLYP